MGRQVAPGQKIIWFKAKSYGWGWYPITWQGWAVILAYLTIVYMLTPVAEASMFRFVALVSLVSLLLIVVCYLAGETPRWRWGK